MAKNLLSILSFHPTNTAILKSSSNEPDSTFNHNLYVYSCVFVFECVCSFVDLCVSECESSYVLVIPACFTPNFYVFLSVEVNWHF